MKRPKSEPCIGQAALLGRRLPEVVGRDRDDDRQHARSRGRAAAPRSARAASTIEPCLARSALRKTALHSSIAPTSCATPPAGRPRSSATLIVWRTRVPPPTPKHHLVLLGRAERAELLDERQDRVLAAVEDRLTADADHDDVGHDRELALGARLRDDALVDERLAHERRLDVRPAVAGDELAHVVLLCHGFGAVACHNRCHILAVGGGGGRADGPPRGPG